MDYKGIVIRRGREEEVKKAIDKMPMNSPKTKAQVKARKLAKIAEVSRRANRPANHKTGTPYHGGKHPGRPHEIIAPRKTEAGRIARALRWARDRFGRMA